MNERLQEICTKLKIEEAPAIMSVRVPQPPMYPGVPECLVPVLMALLIQRNRAGDQHIEEIDAATLRLLAPWINPDKLNFIAFQFEGLPVLLRDWSPADRFEDLQLGCKILVPLGNLDYFQFEVVSINEVDKTAEANSESMVTSLAYAKDSRHTWISTVVGNLKGLSRIDFK